VVTTTAQDPQARLQHALDLAYRYLGQRDRTVLEVRRHLEAKRVEPATLHAAIAELGAAGYLDDERYARAFADDRRRLDGWGCERIAARLHRAGIDHALVEAVLAGQGPEDELAAAVSVLERRVRTRPRDERSRERALGVLVRRGYALETAYDAVRAFEAGRAA
jgi:regulatory protein